MHKGKILFSMFVTAMIYTSPAQAGKTLTLEQAYDLMLEQNPKIHSYQAQIAAANGMRLQQGLHPNPTANIEIENFGGNGQNTSFDAAEYTFGIEQTYETAQKRQKRVRVADFDTEKTRQEAIAQIHMLLAQTKSSYMRIAIGQARIDFAENRLAQVKQAHNMIKQRQAAGKSANIQHSKIDLEVATAEMAKAESENMLRISQRALASLMGQNTWSHTVSIDLTTLPPLPRQAEVAKLTEQTPLYYMQKIAVLRENAVFDLARANAVSDPSFGIGMRHSADSDSTSFLASVSIPLTFFNKQQGHIAAAKANIRAAESDQKSAYLALSKEADTLWRRLSRYRSDIDIYQARLIPAAEKAYAQAQDGFETGAFSFLDFLDAQRTLYNVQESHLTLLENFHQKKSELDMLTGAYTPFIAKMPSDIQ